MTESTAELKIKYLAAKAEREKIHVQIADLENNILNIKDKLDKYLKNRDKLELEINSGPVKIVTGDITEADYLTKKRQLTDLHRDIDDLETLIEGYESQGFRTLSTKMQEAGQKESAYLAQLKKTIIQNIAAKIAETSKKEIMQLTAMASIDSQFEVHERVGFHISAAFFGLNNLINPTPKTPAKTELDAIAKELIAAELA